MDLLGMTLKFRNNHFSVSVVSFSFLINFNQHLGTVNNVVRDQNCCMKLSSRFHLLFHLGPNSILASMWKLIESVKIANWWWSSSNQNNSSILIFNHLRRRNSKWQFRTCLPLIGTFIQNLTLSHYLSLSVSISVSLRDNLQMHF